MLTITRQHSATPPVEMNPVSFEKRSMIPEQVTFVNKIHVVRTACRLEAGVQTENAAKALSTVTKGRNGARNKKNFPQSFKMLKWKLKSFLVHLKLPKGCVVCPYRLQNLCDGDRE